MKTKILGERKRRLEELMRKAQEDPVIKEALEQKGTRQDNQIVQTSGVSLELYKKLKRDSEINAVAFSPLSDELAIVENRNEVGIIDILHNSYLCDFHNYPAEVINAVAFHPHWGNDKYYLVSGGDIGVLRLFIYDSISKKMNHFEKMLQFHPINALDFSQDMKYLAIGTDKELQIYEIKGILGKLDLKHVISKDYYPHQISGVSFCKEEFDKEKLVVAESDKVSFYFWTPKSKLSKLFEIPRWKITDPHKIIDVAFHPDGRHIAVACEDKMVSIFESPDDPVSLKIPKRVWHQLYDSHVTGVDFSPDGRAFVNSTEDGIIYIYHIKNGS